MELGASSAQREEDLRGDQDDGESGYDLEAAVEEPKPRQHGHQTNPHSSEELECGRREEGGAQGGVHAVAQRLVRRDDLGVPAIDPSEGAERRDAASSSR